jgi:hypothetical protein
LGELALVDADSRVARSGRTFGEFLLDENAACHIALGHGFAKLMPDTNGAGANCANTSDHHLEVMIGSPQVDVTGIARHGDTHTLLREGRWARPSAQTHPIRPSQYCPRPHRPGPRQRCRIARQAVISISTPRALAGAEAQLDTRRATACP